MLRASANSRKPGSRNRFDCKRVRRGAAFARRDVPVSWLSAQFCRGARNGRNRIDGVRMLTINAPFGTLLGLGLKTVENVARCKGNPRTLLHADGSAKWWVIVQRDKFTTGLPRRMDTAERQIIAQRRVLSNRSGKRCTRTGIVAVVKVHKVVKSADHRANASARYGPWITGDKHWAMLVHDAIHINPPIPCTGSQAPVGVPNFARNALIRRLRDMDRLSLS